MSEFMRIQEKGQVTIPTKIRKKLKLRKGDIVKVVETKEGVLIKPAEMVFTEAVEEISAALQEKGMTLEELIERGREIRGKIAEKKYGLKNR